MQVETHKRTHFFLCLMSFYSDIILFQTNSVQLNPAQFTISHINYFEMKQRVQAHVRPEIEQKKNNIKFNVC